MSLIRYRDIEYCLRFTAAWFAPFFFLFPIKHDIDKPSFDLTTGGKLVQHGTRGHGVRDLGNRFNGAFNQDSKRAARI